MSASERDFLKDALNRAPTTRKRFAQGVQNALVVWGASLLAFCLVWALLAWLVRILAHRDFGWHSPAAPWMFAIGIAVCALMAVVSSVRWVRGWRDVRPFLRADLAGGRVVEEKCQFNAAKRLQEKEYGGLIYFLRTPDERVFVLYDHESQDLGVNDGDPLASSFQPRTELVIVRAPNTGYVIAREFTGAPLEPGDPYDLLVSPKQWPSSETWCDVPWHELERCFAEPAHRAT